VDLIVVYGPPLSGKTTVARAVAAALPTKAAVVSLDGLRAAIVAPGEDEATEIDFAYGQVRLLVANYLKNRYSVVVEGPYAYVRGGLVVNYEGEIEKLLNLMRTITLGTAVVELRAAPDLIAARAAATGREAELATAQRLAGVYLRRAGPSFRSFDTGGLAPDAIARAVVEALGP
jgi:ribose 1,5-bisphosphokinase PhnN